MHRGEEGLTIVSNDRWQTIKIVARVLDLGCSEYEERERQDKNEEEVQVINMQLILQFHSSQCSSPNSVAMVYAFVVEGDIT